MGIMPQYCSWNSVVMVSGFCNLTVAVVVLTCHHGGGGAVGRQPRELSKRYQRCTPVAQCAHDLGLYTTIPHRLSHSPPPIISWHERLTCRYAYN